MNSIIKTARMAGFLYFMYFVTSIIANLPPEKVDDFKFEYNQIKMAKGKLWIIILIAAILLAASVVVYMKKTQPLEDLTQQNENIIRLTHSQDNYRTQMMPEDVTEYSLANLRGMVTPFVTNPFATAMTEKTSGIAGRRKW